MNKFLHCNILVYLFALTSVFAQTNISLPTKAENILIGNYDPALYNQAIAISDRSSIVDGIIAGVSPDSLKSYLIHLESFQTRNTGSDTVSSSTGIGAARRWIRQKFIEFSTNNENRLVTGYLDFDEDICGMNKHRNVFAILPGADTSIKDIVLIEAHMDSRCESSCNVNCYAPGMDDNGSGTVLVMELARIMSGYTFDRTIVFTTVTGEEQGLVGGRAWAKYIKDKSIPFLACLNNDVIGGVECGTTSSPPTCSPKGDIDSLNVRIFSYSSSADTARYSEHKQLARYIKLQQNEEINPKLTIPMNINIRMREDRSGRGGDHIPFRQEGLLALRFTSQNEHGDGSGTSPDRQHTTTDVLGKDTSTPPDGILDEYYVNFNYLSRNAIMNGVNLGLLASSPKTPDWELDEESFPRKVNILGGDTVFKNYRIGIRSMGSGTLYFDSVYTLEDGYSFELPALRPYTRHFISVAAVKNGIESLFSEEREYLSTSLEEYADETEFLKIYPNPSKGTFTIEVKSTETISTSCRLLIYASDGREVINRPLNLNGEKSIQVDLEGFSTGNYYINLIERGQVLAGSKLLLTAD